MGDFVTAPSAVAPVSGVPGTAIGAAGAIGPFDPVGIRDTGAIWVISGDDAADEAAGATSVAGTVAWAVEGADGGAGAATGAVDAFSSLGALGALGALGVPVALGVTGTTGAAGSNGAVGPTGASCLPFILDASSFSAGTGASAFSACASSGRLAKALKSRQRSSKEVVRRLAGKSRGPGGSVEEEANLNEGGLRSQINSV